MQGRAFLQAGDKGEGFPQQIVLVQMAAVEWHRLMPTDLTFGLAWGGFPVLVGYWSQTEQIGVAALLMALAATLLSLAQRALSKPARYVRRNALDGPPRWSRAPLGSNAGRATVCLRRGSCRSSSSPRPR